MVTKYTPDSINVTVDVSGLQSEDATLTSLASYNTNGLVTQTATDTFTGRTITAETGISVTNGNGVSGNPTIGYDINALTADGSPNGAADYVVTYDASAGSHKKVLLDNIGTSGETAKVWACFTTVTTTALNDSFNVSSLTDNGVGDTTINFTTAMSNANYATVSGSIGVDLLVSQATGSVRLQTYTSVFTLADYALVSVVIFGDQ